MSGTSANNTKIFYSTQEEGPYTNELPLLMEVPEIGGAPEKIDVTTLGDDIKKYIHGKKEMGELVFKFLYDKTTNYSVLKGFADNNTTVYFQLRYPDAMTHSFSAIPVVKMDAGTVNGALTFSCTMTMQSDIEIEDEEE